MVGIHNGHINNHEELSKKYPARKDSTGHPIEVDSAHIFAAFAEGAPTSEIHGWGNLAWYEYTPLLRHGRLYLMKFNADALHVVRLATGELVFCSEIRPIYRAAKMAGTSIKDTYKIEDEQLYYVEPKYSAAGEWEYDQLYDPHEKRVFGFRRVYSGYQGCDASGWPEPDGTYGFVRRHNKILDVNIHTVNQTARTNNECAISGCENKVKKGRKHNLICDPCFEKLRMITTGRVLEHVSV